jgi:hypothetical protein
MLVSADPFERVENVGAQWTEDDSRDGSDECFG